MYHNRPDTVEQGLCGGLLRDLGSHVVDQMIYLLGPVASVDAQMDQAEMPGGAGRCQLLPNAAPRKRRVQIVPSEQGRNHDYHQAFAQAVQDGTPPPVSAETGARTLAVLDAAR